MMTIQQMVDYLKDRGFEVKKDWISRYQCQFTITKHDFGAVSMYKWQPELSPDQITKYQQDFLKRIVNLWKDHYETELEQRMIKQALNSVYGAPKPYKEIYVSTSRPLSHLEIEKMAKANIAITKEPWPKMNPYTNKSTNNPTIKDVIFNDTATIVFWSDGTKTVVKCQEDDIYDPEKGLAMAISKKVLGNGYDYYNTFKKYLKKYEKQVFNQFDAALQNICENVKRVKFTVSKINITPRQPTLEEMANKLTQVTGKDIEELTQLFAAGYTLQAPPVSATLSADDISKTSPADG